MKCAREDHHPLFDAAFTIMQQCSHQGRAGAVWLFESISRQIASDVSGQARNVEGVVRRLTSAPPGAEWVRRAVTTSFIPTIRFLGRGGDAARAPGQSLPPYQERPRTYPAESNGLNPKTDAASFLSLYPSRSQATLDRLSALLNAFRSIQKDARLYEHFFDYGSSSETPARSSIAPYAEAVLHRSGKGPVPLKWACVRTITHRGFGAPDTPGFRPDSVDVVRIKQIRRF